MKRYTGRAGTRVRLLGAIRHYTWNGPITLVPPGAVGVIESPARRFPGSLETTVIKFDEFGVHHVEPGGYEKI